MCCGCRLHQPVHGARLQAVVSHARPCKCAAPPQRACAELQLCTRVARSTFGHSLGMALSSDCTRKVPPTHASNHSCHQYVVHATSFNKECVACWHADSILLASFSAAGMGAPKAVIKLLAGRIQHGQRGEGKNSIIVTHQSASKVRQHSICKRAGAAVSSGVSDQPWGDAETLQGCACCYSCAITCPEQQLFARQGELPSAAFALDAMCRTCTHAEMPVCMPHCLTLDAAEKCDEVQVMLQAGSGCSMMCFSAGQ